MSITLNDAAASAVVYTPLRTEGFRTSYIGPQHTDMHKDMVIANSASPKRNGNSFGNRRSNFNYITAVEVPTANGETETKDMKVEIVTSVPVGTSEAEVNEALARVSSFLADSATAKQLFVVGKSQY